MLLQDLLNIELPIIQAPMAGAQDHRLTVAVSNAGGLGSLPAAMLSGDVLNAELEVIQRQTSKPYNVNFFCHSSPVYNAGMMAAWRQSLNKYYRELGVDDDKDSTAPSRLPFDGKACEIIEHFKPPVVSFHFGLPDVNLLTRVKNTGAKILSSATSVDEGIYLQERGVDVVIAQGLEAGGHRGNFLSDELSLQMNVEDLVKGLVSRTKLPIVAAGGIRGKADINKLISLGAAGVQLGSAYLMSKESKITQLHRAALVNKESRETEITNLFSGRPARGIVNRLMKEIGPLNSDVPDFPLAGNALIPLRQLAEQKGRVDFTPLWCGKNFVDSNFFDLSAAKITRRLMC